MSKTTYYHHLDKILLLLSESEIFKDSDFVD